LQLQKDCCPNRQPTADNQLADIPVLLCIPCTARVFRLKFRHCWWIFKGFQWILIDYSGRRHEDSDRIVRSAAKGVQNQHPGGDVNKLGVSDGTIVKG